MKFLVLALGLALAGTAAADIPAPMRFSAARGGNFGAPVAADEYFYLFTGSTITVWQRGANGTLVLAGDTRTAPLPNGITSLQRQGDYLYASFGRYSASGVAVFSIAERTHPLLLNTFDYSDNPYRGPLQILVVGTELYLFDRETGLYSSSLSNPAQLQFSPLGMRQWVDERFDIDGDRLYNSGMTNNAVLGAWDIADPRAPVSLGFANFPCCDLMGMRMRGNYAYSFGKVFSVLDVSLPSSPAVVAQLPAAGWGGFFSALLPHHAWSVQTDTINVIDIANPLQPQFRGSHAFSAPLLEMVERVGDSVFIAERSNRLRRLAADQPESPSVTSESWLPASAAPWAVAVRGERVLVIEREGIGVLDRASLDRQGFQQIASNGYAQGGIDMAVDGDRAYVMHQAAGFSVIDISNPDQIETLGTWSGPMNALAARNGVVYASYTDGSQSPYHFLSAIDMNNPAAPVVRARIPLSPASRMAVRGNRLFVVPRSGIIGEEIKLVDISNPAALVPIGTYTGCGVVDVAADKRGNLAFLACIDKLDIVDFSDPAQPVLLHSRPASSPVSAVALRGNRLYFFQDGKLVELDVSNPAQPEWISERDTAGISHFHVGSDARLYSLAAGINVDALDQLFQDGLEP